MYKTSGASCVATQLNIPKTSETPYNNAFDAFVYQRNALATPSNIFYKSTLSLFG